MYISVIKKLWQKESLEMLVILKVLDVFDNSLQRRKTDNSSYIVKYSLSPWYEPLSLISKRTFYQKLPVFLSVHACSDIKHTYSRVSIQNVHNVVPMLDDQL